MSSPHKSGKSRSNSSRNQPAESPTPARLDELIEEALVDAYGEVEQASAFCCMVSDNVKFPFKTTLLGMPISVTGVDIDARGEGVVAIVMRGHYKQKVPLADLPLPDPLPAGGEWLLAYRQWAGITQGMDDQAGEKDEEDGEDEA
jgi:hypothetical protein